MVSNILIEVMASVAEEERVKIHRRQEEGIAVAKAKGVVFGRPSIAKPDNDVWKEDYWYYSEARTKSF